MVMLIFSKIFLKNLTNFETCEGVRVGFIQDDRIKESAEHRASQECTVRREGIRDSDRVGCIFVPEFLITFFAREGIMIRLVPTLSREVLIRPLLEEFEWVNGRGSKDCCDRHLGDSVVSVDTGNFFDDVFFDRDVLRRTPRRHEDKKIILAYGDCESKRS